MILFPTLTIIRVLNIKLINYIYGLLFYKLNTMALEVDDNNFNEIVINSDKPVIVDFWAEWCAPCKMIVPILEEISSQYPDKVVVTKCDVDNSPQVTARYGIRNIPTVLYFKDGNVADKQVGAVPRDNFIRKLNALL